MLYVWIRMSGIELASCTLGREWKKIHTSESWILWIIMIKSGHFIANCPEFSHIYCTRSGSGPPTPPKLPFFFLGVTFWSTVHWLSVPDSSISRTGCASVCCGGKTRNLWSETTPTGKSASWQYFWWQCGIWWGDPWASQGPLVDGPSPCSPGFPYPLKPRFL